MMEVNKRWYLYGTVQGGITKNCGVGHSFSFYADVLRHVKWIDEQISLWEN